MPDDLNLTPARTCTVKLHIDIRAPRDVVWTSFIEDIAEWWALANFAAAGGTISLEPCAGGKLIERATTGHEILWATVIEIVPQTRIHFSAPMGPPYAPACLSLFLFTFEDIPDGTRVHIQDNLIGNIDEKLPQSLHDGWTLLFTQGLKKWVEGKAQSESVLGAINE